MGALLDLDDLTERHPGARAELEALRKDAERYRWLRNGPHMWLIQPRGTMDLPHDEEI